MSLGKRSKESHTMFHPGSQRNDYAVNDRTAVSVGLAIITGATSGIGNAYARYFAAQGYNLLITGRRKDLMNQTATELKSIYGIDVEVVIADLSKSSDVSHLLQLISKRNNIRVLVNNAGFGTEDRFREDVIHNQLSMLKVHVNAPVMLIHKVLPQMISNRTGVIINVSSLAAFIPTAGNSMYSSTKSFLVNFTESLHLDVGKLGIRVQCLCPGFTRTDFHKNLNVPWKSRFGWLQWMKPEEVVEYSISCLNKGQVICVPGFVYRVISHLAGAVPRNLYYLIAHKMDKSLGRSSQNSDAILPALK